MKACPMATRRLRHGPWMVAALMLALLCSDLSCAVVPVRERPIPPIKCESWTKSPGQDWTKTDAFTEVDAEVPVKKKVKGWKT